MGKFRPFFTELSACDTIKAEYYCFTFLFIINCYFKSYLLVIFNAYKGIV